MKRRTFMLTLAAGSLMGVPLYASAQQQDVKARTIRLGHLVQAGNPNSLGALKFAEILDKKSNGKLKIREFPNSELGSELQQQSALRGGIQEMFISTPTSLVGMVPEFGALDLPFTFTSVQEGHALVEGPWGKMMLDRLAEKGIVGIAFWDLGFRNMTNSKRPILRLEDFDGLKLRVMPNPVYLDTFKLLGANPVAMAFGEVFTALESKVIDGQENPFSVIYSNKLYEVQKYLSLTNHTNSIQLVQVSRKFWDGLSDTERKLIRESVAEATTYQRQINMEQSQTMLDNLKTKGMLVNEISLAEIGRMRKATESIAEKFFSSYDPEAVKLFKAEMARIRAAK